METENVETTDGLRPKTMDTFIGQAAIKSALGVMLKAATMRREPLEHVVFYGQPGLGKTTMAGIIANEMRADLRILSAPSIQSPGELARVMKTLQHGDVLFLDEIHRLRADIAEIIYSAMEDFTLAIRSSGPEAGRVIKLKRFTLVGATTDYGMLPDPLRDRFGHAFPLELYSVDELEEVVLQATVPLNVLIEGNAARLIAERARGTPRIALRLLRRCRDLADVRGEYLSEEIAIEALEMLQVDDQGLDATDRQYLHVLVGSYGGGPAGSKALAASSGIDQATIETKVEPWLLRTGMIVRTRRGRRITKRGHNHVRALLNHQW